MFWPGAAAGSLDVLARALSDSYGIMCRTGYLCAQPLVTKLGGGPVLRMSAYVYNDAEDVAAAFAAIDELSASGVLRHA
jgi:cysteine desulfurase / selenocysteine lyase